MTVFRRRKDGRSADTEPDEQLDVDEAADHLEDPLQVLQEGGEDGGDAPRQARTESAAGSAQGPWDVADAPQDEVARLDLGSIRVPGLPGVEVQVNLDEASGTVVAVTAVHADSALQLQAFAASRNEPIWPDVRRELAAQITSDGGLADVEQDKSGDAGTLRAKVPFPQPDGSVALGEVRFIGTDGPRWMLRGVLSGRGASDPAAALTLLQVYRGVVVVRGNEAFAPTEPLPLRLPDQSGQPGPGVTTGEPEQPAGPAGLRPLDLDGTGQRITQTR